VNMYNNNLTRLDISKKPGLINLNISQNSLNQTEVDRVLQTMDSYNTENGYLDLTGNAEPSSKGAAHANNLTARGWEVKSSDQFVKKLIRTSSFINIELFKNILGINT